MRRIVWMLGAFGAMCLAISAGTAQETQDNSQGATKTTRSTGLNFLGRGSKSTPVQKTEADAEESASASRLRGSGVLRYERPKSSNTSAGKPTQTGLKNYHRELFGSEPPTPEQVRSHKLSQLRERSQNNSAASRPKRDSAVRPAGATIPQSAKPEDSATPGSIVQADFIREPGTPDTVRPVAGTNAGEPTLLAPPLIDQESPEKVIAGSAPQLPAAPGTSNQQQNIATNFTTDSPNIQISWNKVGDISVGQESDIELHVVNNGQSAASNVSIDAYFPSSIRLTKTVPSPISVTRFVSWSFMSLDAGEEQTIVISLIPSRRGEIAANANVRFTAAGTKLFTAEEPLLEVVVDGGKEFMLGEPAPQIVTVSNPGTGVAKNVVVEVRLPKGLEHSKGERLRMELGPLNPGEKRSVRLSLTAAEGGEQTFEVTAHAGEVLQESATGKVNVLSPSLQLAVNGPALRYVGRVAKYDLTISNDGQALTNNVRSMYIVPAGFEFLSAARGGKYDEETRTVSWFVGSVQPQETIELSLRLKPVKLGDFAHLAKVSSEQGASAEAQVATRIDGTASLVLEVVDVDDPVEIGRETAYEVRVLNKGSKEAHNVGLSVELPIGVKLIDAKGPSKHLSENGLVVFKSLPILPPGKTAAFRIQVQGTEEGNRRLRARLISDSIQEPLTVEELTRFYAD